MVVRQQSQRNSTTTTTTKSLEQSTCCGVFTVSLQLLFDIKFGCLCAKLLKWKFKCIYFIVLRFDRHMWGACLHRARDYSPQPQRMPSECVYVSLSILCLSVSVYVRVCNAIVEVEAIFYGMERKLAASLLDTNLKTYFQHLQYTHKYITQYGIWTCCCCFRRSASECSRQ